MPATQHLSPEIRIPSADCRAQNEDRLWLVAATAYIVLQLWFGMISSSFWLDETGTWWIIKDGPAEAVRRAIFWSGQSPLYYLIAWLSSRAFGLNEIALRIPSVLAMCGAIFFLYRIAERLLDRTAGAMAAFLLVCTASFYAVDARPYALALLCLTGATWMLLRWLDTNRISDAVLYIALATLAVYAHVVLSLGLAAGAIYAIAMLRNQPRRVAWLVSFQLAVALLALPLAGELRTFYAARSTHAFTPPPGVENLLTGLIPCSLAGALVLLVWIAMSLRHEANLSSGSWKTALLIGTWAWLPPLMLYALAVSSDLRLYVAKYYSSSLPGQALLAGALLASITRAGVRRALIVAIALVSLLASGRLKGQSHGNENWRDALAFVRSEAGTAPVLLVSGFVEASSFPVLQDPKLRDIFFAPELLYGEPRRTIRLPNGFNGRPGAEMENIVKQLRHNPRFYLVTENPDRGYEMWLLGALGSAGSHCTTLSTGNRFGYLWITRFLCE